MTWAERNRIFLSLPVAKLLAITAYGEAAGEGGEGMLAVLNVIRNRTQYLNEFGDTNIYNLTSSPYHAVILKPYQFSMYNIRDPVRNIAERIGSNFDAEVNVNQSLSVAYNLAQMLLANAVNDNTGGATHYHATSVTPAWSKTMPVTGQIGRHIFYASRPVAPPSVLTAGIIPEEEIAPMEAGLGVSSIAWILVLGIISGIIYSVIKGR